MSEQVPSEELSITLRGLNGDPLIKCIVDDEGDLCIEHTKTGMHIYIPCGEMLALRDLLIKACK